LWSGHGYFSAGRRFCRPSFASSPADFNPAPARRIGWPRWPHASHATTRLAPARTDRLDTGGDGTAPPVAPTTGTTVRPRLGREPTTWRIAQVRNSVLSRGDRRMIPMTAPAVNRIRAHCGATAWFADHNGSGVQTDKHRSSPRRCPAGACHHRSCVTRCIGQISTCPNPLAQYSSHRSMSKLPILRHERGVREPWRVA